MMPDNLFVGRPIRNAQIYLRRIAYEYDDIPVVVPDGIFGKQTAASVKAFQKKFFLPQTGEIDNSTWDKLTAVYDNVVEQNMPPEKVRIFFNPYIRIYPGETNDYLYPVQSIMLLVSKQFDNLGTLAITGIHDVQSVEMVQKLQDIFRIESNGIIDKKFWNRLAGLYEIYAGIKTG